MIKQLAAIFSCCLVLSLMHYPEAFATHSPCLPNPATTPVVTVVIGSETRTGPDQVILNDAGGTPHTYDNGLTIGPLVGGYDAVVKVECDTAGDRLTLTNAKITVSAPVTSKVIQYWATFDKSPLPSGHTAATPRTTTGSPDVFYKMPGAGSGVITSNNASPAAYDKIIVKGEILNPPTGTWKTIGTRTKTVLSGAPQSDPFFSSEVSWKWQPRPPELTGERHLRGTVTITLNNAADRVELGNGIVIYNSSTACPDCDAGGEQPPSTWWMTRNSTAKVCGCPLSMTEDGMAAKKKLDLFANTTWSSLSADMARGQGEHLAALARLMQVSREREDEFFAIAQEHYGRHLSHNKSLSPEAMVADLQKRWASELLVSSIH